jgi:8-oxo-dGTP pyrophosphatase MutT (NUDIX family)
LRTTAGRLEILLLRRSEDARFIPGAWVFPGGRLDPSDADPGLAARITGPVEATTPVAGATPADPDSHRWNDDAPATAFRAAAFRETFEETGILLHAAPRTPRSESLASAEAGEDARLRVQQGELPFGELLDRLELELRGEALTYIGHWVTPASEPIRFDTRFFATEVPDGCPVYPDGAELVEALWLSPAEALERNRQGALPMAFPTMVTLEELQSFRDPSSAIRELGARPVPRLVPRLAPAPGGVRFRLGD